MRAIFLLMYRYELAEYVLVKKQFIQDFFLETAPPYLLHAFTGCAGRGIETRPADCNHAPLALTRLPQPL
jgi:hypothetical protein